MTVDETGRDDPVVDDRDLEVGMIACDVGERAERDDDPVLDDEKPIGEEARGLLLVADVLPRVVGEVEEFSTDAGERDGVPFETGWTGDSSER